MGTCSSFSLEEMMGEQVVESSLKPETKANECMLLQQQPVCKIEKPA